VGMSSKKNRRKLVEFDPEHFRKRREFWVSSDRVEIFREAFRSNLWGGDSRSGPGSSREQTAKVEAALPAICKRLGVGRFLDVPCGDFSWMSRVDLRGVSYIGGDLLPEIVAENRERHSQPDRTFLRLDVMTSDLPPADLMLCRDCLVHLSNADVLAALRNIVGGEISWLLTTTFPDETENVDIVTGDWRPVDLTAGPFNLPPPVELLNEGCTEQSGAFSDKSLGLWSVSDLAGALEGRPT
jgi:hypothetical protein